MSVARDIELQSHYFISMISLNGIIESLLYALLCNLNLGPGIKMSYETRVSIQLLQLTFALHVPFNLGNYIIVFEQAENTKFRLSCFTTRVGWSSTMGSFLGILQSDNILLVC